MDGATGGKRFKGYVGMREGLSAGGALLGGVEDISIVPPGVMTRDVSSTIGRDNMPGIEGVLGGVSSTSGFAAVPAMLSRQAASRERAFDDPWASMLVIGGSTSDIASHAAILIGVDDESAAISI
jgi:hypothetical protein